MNHLIKLLKKGQSTIAFFPIKPNFADKIINSQKHFEYRKSNLRKNVSYIVIYSSSPVKKIVGIAKVGQVLAGPPSSIWERTKKSSGVTRKFFREYFKDATTAYAIQIAEVIVLDIPVCPTLIDSGFNIPQSFSYVDIPFLEKVLRTGRCKRKPVGKHKVIFVGGIHGVGKSTICKNACKKNAFVHLTASELIKTASNSITLFDFASNKKVSDIKDNQSLLITALKQETWEGGSFLLDGHYVLFDAVEKIQKISLSTFKKILPDQLVVITGDPAIIRKRLYSRDGKEYDSQILREMQKKETDHALSIGKKLGIEVHQIEMDDTESLIDLLQ